MQKVKIKPVLLVNVTEYLELEENFVQTKWGNCAHSADHLHQNSLRLSREHFQPIYNKLVLGTEVKMSNVHRI